ncbi:MAG: ATP phosphoribosyltransferase regulatory subunit [Burkholderiaceae bacterium]
MPRWLLPESISDVLPSEARRIEELRRLLLDQYRSYGYELVMPPMIEHLESLLTGAGTELGLRTFKLVDQLSGRTMGVRADITPQVARIDAHLLGRVGVARLCYAGSVLHARPAGAFASREPIHVGAEIYGHAGVEADVEILDLMVRSIQLAGIDRVRVDLCHMGIVPALLEQDRSLDAEQVYGLLQSKDVPGLRALLDGRGSQVGEALLALTRLYGPATGASSAIALARATLPPLAGIGQALDALQRLVESPQLQRLSGLDLSIDLADLRGYRYHSGITFAAYVPSLPNAVARGGRYDNVGEVFGRARPATGFSLELRELAALQTPAEPARAIRAPWSDDPQLLARIAELRAEGQIVIQSLPGHESEQQEFVFDRELVAEARGWAVRALA